MSYKLLAKGKGTHRDEMTSTAKLAVFNGQMKRHVSLF